MTIQQIEAKLESYAVFHLAQLVQVVQTMNTAFDAEQYESVGEDAGKLCQQIF